MESSQSLGPGKPSGASKSLRTASLLQPPTLANKAGFRFLCGKPSASCEERHHPRLVHFERVPDERFRGRGKRELVVIIRKLKFMISDEGLKPAGDPSWLLFDSDLKHTSQAMQT